MNLFTKSLVFASQKHQAQRRKNKDIPYINHPIQVAHILSLAGVEDSEVLAAGVLHDTVEDTETTAEELEQQFGAKVKNIVLECSDNKLLGKVQRKIKQIEKAHHASIEAKLVKIADKISNNRGLLIDAPSSWTKQRVQGYFLWSQAVCNNLKGVNEKLDLEIRKIFDESGINKLSEQQKTALLSDYYKALQSSLEN